MSAHLPLPSVPTVAARPARTPLAYGVMVLSGFAGLGYQIVWTQQCALWLGHEAAAVLAVVSAFFGGLGVGALALAPRIERSPHPARWYAACEVLIALWSLALALLMAPISGWMPALTGVQPAPLWQGLVAFVGTWLLLLPATMAMGATLPAMVQVAARLLVPAAPGPAPRGGVTPITTPRAAPIAALYACNTLGAVLGVLATAFWLVPAWGLARTAGLCAAANLLCAAAMLAVPAQAPQLAVGRFSVQAPRRLAWLRTPAQRRLLLLLVLTGGLGIGDEVLVVRVISQVAENTIYTIALLLVVYLVGSALGAAAFQRWSALQRVGGADRLPAARDAGLPSLPLTDKLLGLLALACLLGTASLWWADAVRAAVAQALGAITGDGMAAALAAEATLALLAFGPSTLVMGALFSHLGQQAQAIGFGFGRALGFNTLGAALAPLCFGVLLVPALGAKWVLLGVAVGYLLLLSRRAWASPVSWGPAAAAAALALWAPPLVFVDVPDGGQIISYHEGASAAVSVVQDADGVARLRIDNRQQEGSSASLLADARQALLPLLLHPAPQRALFLGLGTGVTASAAAKDPSLQVDAVELLPEVISAAAHFRTVASTDTNTASNPAAARQPNPRLQVLNADARRYVRTSPQRYDLVVADNFHPARGGSGALYTVEHFQAVRNRLTPDGVFCQWLPLHQLDLHSLRSIVQSFLVAYPGAWAMLATNSLDTPVLGLVARNSAGLLAWPALQARLASHQLPQDLAAFGLTDALALLGGFVAGPQALHAFAGSSPLNTDDRPVVAYRAPRITYAPDSEPRDRLASLLSLLHIRPAELLADGADSATAQRLAAYWLARDRFIAAGMDVRPVADPRAMLAQVGGPLLAVLRTSPDFRPAYDPLLRLASALGRTDPAGAQALLATLLQVQPQRPEAAAALAGLGSAMPADTPTATPAASHTIPP